MLTISGLESKSLIKKMERMGTCFTIEKARDINNSYIKKAPCFNNRVL